MTKIEVKVTSADGSEWNECATITKAPHAELRDHDLLKTAFNLLRSSFNDTLPEHAHSVPMSADDPRLAAAH